MIHYYTPDDYQGLVNLLSSCNMYDEVWEDSIQLEKKISHDPQSIILRKENNTIIGSVYISDDGRQGFVRRLAVSPSHRNHGIGSQLLETAEELLASRGRIETSILVKSQDTNVQKRYRKRGYQGENNFTFMYKSLDA